MKLTEQQYKELCKLCPYLVKSGNRRVCTFGKGCVKDNKKG